MQLVLKNTVSYKSTITVLSILTALSGFGCMLVGYLFLPFAAAFYAALLVYENSSKRIASYMVPIGIFVANFLAKGFFSLEAVAYVVIGVIIYVSSKRGTSKGETAFWTTLTLTVLFFVSAIFLAFDYVGAIGLTSIKQFFSNLFITSKTQCVELLTSLTTADEEGIKYFVCTPHEAEALFHEFVILLIPITILAAFLLSGLTFKIFSATVRRCSGNDSIINLWNFRVSNFIAYFYIAVAILSIFAATDKSAFSYVLITLNTVLSAVFAYIGVTVVYAILRTKGMSAFLATSAIVIVCILFSSFSTQLISFVGVYFNIVANKILTVKK